MEFQVILVHSVESDNKKMNFSTDIKSSNFHFHASKYSNYQNYEFL